MRISMDKFPGWVRSQAIEFFHLAQETAFHLKYDLRDSALRGFGVPMLISNVALTTVLGVAAVGSFSIGLEVASNFICKRKCRTCNGWEALRCTMCRGSGKVKYHVKNFGLKDGEKPTTKNAAVAIADGRAEVAHFPTSFDIELPLPTKECPTCNGSGVMNCTECKDNPYKLSVSMDDLAGVPWKTWDVLRKTDYPCEHILESMEDPIVAAFWLLARPELEAGIKFDEDVKQKLGWQYRECMRYDAAHKFVADREPGWEHMQELLFAIDPIRAREDPVIVRNVPYYKARKKIEAEVMKLEVPSRPPNWGDLNLPLKDTDWSEDELKDPKKKFERNTLLVGQKQLVERFLDTAWQMKWRKQKYDELVEERVRPYIDKVKEGADPAQLVSNSSKVGSQQKETKTEKKQEEAAKKSKENQGGRKRFLFL